MLFQIVFRESGIGKESAASVRKRPDIFLQRSEGSVIACEQLFRLIKTGRRNRGINRCKLRNLLAGTLVVKIREVAALRLRHVVATDRDRAAHALADALTEQPETVAA